METKICKHCREQVDKKAKRCPKCGGNLGLPAFLKVLIIIIVILFCIVGCVSSCTKSVGDAVNDSINETKDSYKDINGKTSFKINETFQNKYEKITMTEVNTNFTDYSEYLQPGDGKKYIMVKFEVQNISEDKDELYISSLNFNVYVDGVACDSSYIGGNKYNDLSATLGKDKKSVGYIFYKVPQNANKITIEYNADFWTDGTIIEFIVSE